MWSSLIQAISAKGNSSKKQSGGRSFTVSAAKVWNHLPSHLRTAPTIHRFKNDFKTFLYKTAFIKS